MNNSILITGANGFVGKALFNYLYKKKMNVHGVVRGDNQNNYEETNLKVLTHINAKTNWDLYLKEVDTVIHTAGYSKFPFNNDKDVSKLYDVNVFGTHNLAKQAAKYGVKKFIYISSIKVHGENTKPGFSFKNDSVYNPQDVYALSKVKAEEGLKKIRETSNLDIIIIRPPLIYGKGLKSNLLKLIYAVKIGVPLPFKNITKNKISLLSIDNLNNFIYKCINHKKVLNMNFVISDNKTISTKYLIEEIALVLNRKASLFYFPKTMIYLLSFLFFKQKLIKYLLYNLEIDNSFSELKLNWKPNVSLNKSLKELLDG